MHYFLLVLFFASFSVSFFLFFIFSIYNWFASIYIKPLVNAIVVRYMYVCMVRILGEARVSAESSALSKHGVAIQRWLGSPISIARNIFRCCRMRTRSKKLVGDIADNTCLNPHLDFIPVTTQIKKHIYIHNVKRCSR